MAEKFVVLFEINTTPAPDYIAEFCVSEKRNNVIVHGIMTGYAARTTGWINLIEINTTPAPDYIAVCLQARITANKIAVSGVFADWFRDGALAETGTLTESFTAQRIVEAVLAETGILTESFTAERIVEAAFAETGTLTVSLQGEVVAAAPTTPAVPENRGIKADKDKDGPPKRKTESLRKRRKSSRHAEKETVEVGTPEPERPPRVTPEEVVTARETALHARAHAIAPERSRPQSGIGRSAELVEYARTTPLFEIAPLYAPQIRNARMSMSIPALTFAAKGDISERDWALQLALGLDWIEDLR